MTTIPLVETPVVQQEPLQRIGGEPESEHCDHMVYTIFVRKFFGRKAGPRFKGRPIVKKIDPAKWPYGAEVDCREDWDASGA